MIPKDTRHRPPGGSRSEYDNRTNTRRSTWRWALGGCAAVLSLVALYGIAPIRTITVQDLPHGRRPHEQHHFHPLRDSHGPALHGKSSAVRDSAGAGGSASTTTTANPSGLRHDKLTFNVNSRTLSMLRRVFANATRIPGIRAPCYKSPNLPTLEATGPTPGPTPKGRVFCLPSFYILGPPKTGTEDLFFRIAQHPDMFPPAMREIHFWSSRVCKHRGRSLLKYTANFDDLNKHMEGKLQRGRLDPFALTGESSTSFMYNHCMTGESAAAVLAAVQPDAKLIFVHRDPTDRVWSDRWFFQHAMERHNAQFRAPQGGRKLGFKCGDGWLERPVPKGPATPHQIQRSFHMQMEFELDRIRDCQDRYGLDFCLRQNKSINTMPSPGCVNSGVLPGHPAYSVYETYVREWLNFFPRSSLLVLRLTDYPIGQAPGDSAARKRFMHKVFDHVGLRTNITLKQWSHVAPDRIVHRTANHEFERVWHQPRDGMLPETRKMLDDFFAPHEAKLWELLGAPDSL